MRPNTLSSRVTTISLGIYTRKGKGHQISMEMNKYHTNKKIIPMKSITSFTKIYFIFCLFSVSKNVTEKVKSPYCQKVILKFWRNTNNTSLLKTKEKKKKRKKSELSSMRFLKGINHYNIYLQHSILLAQIRERTLHFTYNITNTYSLSTFDRSRFCYIFLFC